MTEIFADCTIESPYGLCHLFSENDFCVLSMNDYSTRNILFSLTPFFVGNIEKFKKIHQYFASNLICMEIRLKDKTVIVMGAGARPGFTSRIIGASGIEFRLASFFSRIFGFGN